MKKLLSVLLTLCLLCTAAALAETVLTLDDMPAVVLEDDNTTVELSAFNGSWIGDKFFVGETHVDAETMAASYGISVPAFRIEDGILYYTDESGEGGAVQNGYACVFEAGQLQGEIEGVQFCIDTLEDGNIVMSVFQKGENEEVICVSIFMVRAEA